MPIKTPKSFSIVRPQRSWWMITVGGGYGEFLFHGTESEAEKRRANKKRIISLTDRGHLSSNPDRKYVEISLEGNTSMLTQTPLKKILKELNI